MHKCKKVFGTPSFLYTHLDLGFGEEPRSNFEDDALVLFQWAYRTLEDGALGWVAVTQLGLELGQGPLRPEIFQSV